MRITLTTLFCCFCLFCFSQDFKQPAPTASAKRLKAASIRADLEKASLVNKVEFENIGPAVMSGRVVDLAVNPKNPTEFYVAYASGGLWKTKNNGVSFIPIFDNEDVLTTGAVAVNWSSGTIWLGTGEVNSSRSSYAGTGIYKSTDDGETWTHLGLAESHHIGRIVLHPDDPNTAWVAVLGHLYSPNKDRGVYKTIDGGKTWNQTLFENENAGAIDLVMHPDNPNELYAAIWERQRRAWNFWEAGSGTGIHKSIDGGLTWTRISTPKSGFPTGENIGRIGLDIYSKNGNTILFAVVDNQNRRPEEEKEDTDELTKADLRKISVQDFLKLEDDQLEAFLRDNGFPKKHTAKSVKLQIEDGEIEPMTLVEYLEDANSLLFDTPVVGLEVYRSDDSGKKWTKTHDGF
ncbi:MAG: glycosyl hydrolase, partial [Bacteroidota bacterium]